MSRVTMSAQLEVEGLVKHFGAVKAVNGVSFEVNEGEILGIAGPNGAGKTVTFNLITGEIASDSGRVTFEGADITDMDPNKIVDHRIARTFQEVRVFPELTVFENLLFAGQEKSLSQNLKTLASGSLSNLEQKNATQAEELLETVEMTRLKEEKAEMCSYGQKKILEFINAMMLNPEPRLIFLDEPMAGVNPTMMNNLQGYIEEFNDRGKTFIIVEHNLRLLQSLCDRVVVLDAGEKIADGTPRSVASDEEVREAYFAV